MAKLSLQTLVDKSVGYVAQRLEDRPPQEQVELLSGLIERSAGSATVARQVIDELGLHHHQDLLELATAPRTYAAPTSRGTETRSNQGRSRLDARVSSHSAEPAALTGETIRILAEFGLPRDRFEAFTAGAAVMFSQPTRTGHDTEGVLQNKGDRLVAGIISVHDVGGGVRALLGFRSLAVRLARALGHSEVELLGGAVINKKLEAVLKRQAFEPGTADIPEELGGGVMAVYTKRFGVDK